jgi:hypothetical protein
MRALLLLIFTAMIAGCAPSKGTLAKKANSGVLDEARVLEIARGAVASNDTWVDRAEFESPERQPDGSWRVIVWRLPKTPGGDRLISIDEKGKVTSYIRGL